MEQAWTVHKLAGGGEVKMAPLPQEIRPDDADDFERWWKLHPLEHPEIMMHGKPVAIPRWQQAYGCDYRFSGQVSPAQPLTPEMSALLEWARRVIHPELNGVLMNWYDGAKGHYIGAHRDSTMGLIKGSPIVTISLGERRAFRMRPYKKKGFEDFNVGHGDVLVIPWQTNLVYTHEVPRARRYTHRRVSITLRAFDV
jgi:alkylated DNA repair dioxygenase AlkB